MNGDSEDHARSSDIYILGRGPVGTAKCLPSAGRLTELVGTKGSQGRRQRGTGRGDEAMKVCWRGAGLMAGPAGGQSVIRQDGTYEDGSLQNKSKEELICIIFDLRSENRQLKNNLRCLTGLERLAERVERLVGQTENLLNTPESWEACPSNADHSWLEDCHEQDSGQLQQNTTTGRPCGPKRKRVHHHPSTIPHDEGGQHQNGSAANKPEALFQNRKEKEDEQERSAFAADFFAAEKSNLHFVQHTENEVGEPDMCDGNEGQVFTAQNLSPIKQEQENLQDECSGEKHDGQVRCAENTEQRFAAVGLVKREPDCAQTMGIYYHTRHGERVQTKAEAEPGNWVEERTLERAVVRNGEIENGLWSCDAGPCVSGDEYLSNEIYRRQPNIPDIDVTTSLSDCLPEEVLRQCWASESPQKMTNRLLSGLYTREFMASHSVTGAAFSRHPHSAKPALPPKHLKGIIDMVLHFFPTETMSQVKSYIRQKLQNECKGLRKRSAAVLQHAHDP
uniref:BEN domain-containing protein n=1 Tax=Eptatretus burgeri TaxID=7764 RepID=A0A8C4QYZ7_EPTBU